MGRRSRWQDGRRAWERLNGWHQPATSRPGHPSDGDAALTALADLHLVKDLANIAEQEAVRTARLHNKSWTEIATALGVSKQAAWERWHDLDPSPEPHDREPNDREPNDPA